MKKIRILLFVLILIGIALLGTQKIWVPKLVDKIISSEVDLQQAKLTSGWKTFSDPTKGFTFKYPENINTKYISTVDWPPKVQIQKGPFSCTNGGKETARAGQTLKEIINGKNYCVTKIAEGAAGSIYTEYAYATELQNKVLFFTFTLRAVQCANYEDPQKTACEKERGVFDIDSLIGTILQSVRLF